MEDENETSMFVPQRSARAIKVATHAAVQLNARREASVRGERQNDTVARLRCQRLRSPNVDEVGTGAWRDAWPRSAQEPLSCLSYHISPLTYPGCLFGSGLASKYSASAPLFLAS